MEQADAVVVLCVLFVGVGDVFADVADSVGNGLGGQFVVHPVLVTTIVFDAFVLTESFTDEHAALVIAFDRHDVGHVRLGRK